MHLECEEEVSTQARKSPISCIVAATAITATTATPTTITTAESTTSEAGR